MSKVSDSSKPKMLNVSNGLFQSQHSYNHLSDVGAGLQDSDYCQISPERTKKRELGQSDNFDAHTSSQASMQKYKLIDPETP